MAMAADRWYDVFRFMIGWGIEAGIGHYRGAVAVLDRGSRGDFISFRRRGRMIFLGCVVVMEDLILLAAAMVQVVITTRACRAACSAVLVLLVGVRWC
jgi:hypothetical protein